MIMIFIYSLTAAIAAKKNFHKNLKLQLFTSFSCNRVSFIFDVFVDLFNEQIERRMLIIPLSRGSQLHRHTEAIGVVVEMRKLVFDENIAPGAEILVFWGAGRKRLGFHLGFKSGVPAKLGGVSVVVARIKRSLKIDTWHAKSRFLDTHL